MKLTRLADVLASLLAPWALSVFSFRSRPSGYEAVAAGGRLTHLSHVSPNHTACLASWREMRLSLHQAVQLAGFVLATGASRTATVFPSESRSLHISLVVHSCFGAVSISTFASHYPSSSLSYPTVFHFRALACRPLHCTYLALYSASWFCFCQPSWLYWRLPDSLLMYDDGIFPFPPDYTKLHFRTTESCADRVLQSSTKQSTAATRD